MSQTSINQAANDVDLQIRVQSAAYAEAFNNPDLEHNQFADQIRRGYANLTGLYYAVAVSTEAAYETGLLNGRGAPGHDADIITDADIVAAIQMHWPQDPPQAPNPTPQSHPKP